MSKNQIIREEMLRLGQRIDEVKHDCAKRIGSSYDSNGQRVPITIEFLHILIEDFKHEEAVIEHIEIFGRETGELALENDANLDESIDDISTMRRAIWKEIKAIMIEQQTSIDTVFEVVDRFDLLLERIIFEFSSAYIDSYKENLEKAEDEFLKLSAPVVLIQDGIAVLPIIGGINEKRADILMKTTLAQAVDKDLDYLFISLQGFTLIDTMVAHNIHKIILSLELVGVKTVIAGIRPEVTQTLVELGIDFSGLETYSSLQQALSKYRVFING